MQIETVGYTPVFQCPKQFLYLPGLQVSTDRAFNFELLRLLVELATNQVEVDSVNDQVF